MSLSVDLHHDGPPLDFQASIPEGRITALVGPSGSGKTSILRALAGLLRVRRARVALGSDIWDDAHMHLRTRERPIGFVPQHYGLFPHMTAQGNVEAALTHLPSKERQARALHCMALAHVKGLELRRPDELSGGQRQRVALARALAREPRVLLLDEPFSAVDRSTRKRLYMELRRLHEQLQTTVVLVTHDLDEAAQLASHLCLIRRGRLLQCGATTDVLTRPASEQAARLLDISNIFDARAQYGRDGALLLRWGPHVLQGPQASGIAPDAALRWAVLPTNVQLVRTDKPWGRHLENPVPALVHEVLELGAEAVVWLEVPGIAGGHLQMRLPARAIRRYEVTAGAQVTVCLRRADIVIFRDA